MASNADLIKLGVATEVADRIVFGAGARATLPDLVRRVAAVRPGAMVIVTGRVSRRKPWLPPLLHQLVRLGAVHFETAAGYPTVQTIGTLVNRLRAKETSLLVGIGGGSVLDTVKVVALAKATAQPVRALLDQTISDCRPLPIIAVPTTSGAGSEVTGTATIWDFEAKRKHAVASSSLTPAKAVIDPDLTATLPRSPFASAVMDALAHAIEASWSIKATEGSRRCSLAALNLLVRTLDERGLTPQDPTARECFAFGALLAGLAIGRSQTTAPHALSYPLTVYYRVAHGHACSMFLPIMLRYNAGIGPSDCAAGTDRCTVLENLRQIFEAIGTYDADAAAERILSIRRAVGLDGFADHVAFDVRLLARAAAGYGRLENNPRRLHVEQLVELLTRLQTDRSEKLQ